MTISEKQRAHARRNALQDAKKHAYTADVLKKSGKPATWTPERVQETTEYEASLIGPKREPARTQWKEIYRDNFAAYMINANHLSPEHEQQERIRLDPGAQPAPAATQMNTAQTIIRAGKDEYGRSNIYAIWQTAGTWYSAQIWQGQIGQPLDRGEPINVQTHATRKEALARRRALAQGEEPELPVITPLPAVNHREEAAAEAQEPEPVQERACTIQWRNDILGNPVTVTQYQASSWQPREEPPAPKRKDDTEQMAMF